jgi:hypothetical protein
MIIPTIPEGQQLVLELKTIHCMMTGVERIFIRNTLDPEYCETVIRFEGIAFYDVARVKREELYKDQSDLSIAILCLHALQDKKDMTDEVLLAAATKAEREATPFA